MTALSRPVSSRRDSKEILAKKPTEHETNHHLYVASFVCISGAGFLSSMARWGIDAWEAQAGKTLPKQASQRPALKTFYATGSKESQKKEAGSSKNCPQGSSWICMFKKSSRLERYSQKWGNPSSLTRPKRNSWRQDPCCYLCQRTPGDKASANSSNERFST